MPYPAFAIGWRLEIRIGNRDKGRRMMIRGMYGALRSVYSDSDYAPEMHGVKKCIILLPSMLCAVVVQSTCPIQADDLFMCHLAKWIAYCTLQGPACKRHVACCIGMNRLNDE